MNNDTKEFNELECLECGYIAKDRQGFNSHIRWHKLKSKDYYDKYLKKEGDGICRVCGKPTKFYSMWRAPYYTECCSVRCSQLNPKTQAKISKTCMERYGTMHAFQAESVKANIAKTNLERYGVEHTLASPEIRDRIAKTNLERYGSENVFGSKEIQERIRQTMQERYGVNHSIQLVNEKSNIEKYFECVLKMHNIPYEYSYKCDKYPFYCDFYLPEQDCFVEINAFFTHGTHWFDENNDDDLHELKKLQHAYECGDDFAHRKIHGWTVRDVLKRNTAKQNNLNYVVLWNYDDIDEWVAAGFPNRKDWQ